MSEIDLKSAREAMLRLDHKCQHVTGEDAILVARYIDQLAKENEQLKAKLVESGEGANAVDRELGKVMRERDEALSKLAADEAEAETMRKMRDDAQRLGHSDVLDALEALAAMQEGIVEAVRRAQCVPYGSVAREVLSILLPLVAQLIPEHGLERSNQRDRSKPSDLEKRFKMYQSIAHARHNETMRVAELIAQAVCEAESDEALDALVDLARKVLKI